MRFTLPTSQACQDSSGCHPFPQAHQLHRSSWSICKFAKGAQNPTTSWQYWSQYRDIIDYWSTFGDWITDGNSECDHPATSLPSLKSISLQGYCEGLCQKPSQNATADEVDCQQLFLYLLIVTLAQKATGLVRHDFPSVKPCLAYIWDDMLAVSNNLCTHMPGHSWHKVCSMIVPDTEMRLTAY